MSREHKYRAWNEYHNRMFDVYEINFDHDIIKCREMTGLKTFTFGMIDTKLLQFTGLKDKSGVDIYEGGIVLVRDVRICEVIFHEHAGCWDLKLRSVISSESIGSVSPASYRYHVEVIGSIQENPELMEAS